MMPTAEVKKHAKQSLELAKIGKGPSELQNGKEFYKYMFTNHPDLRRYFKGAESFTADDVEKSERFEKQGQRILLAVHILADTFDDDMTFRAYARETVNRHRQYKMDPELWSAFFTVLVNFLASRGSVSDEQKKAWEQLGKVFNEECQSHLTSLGLPHC
ncbi:globin [Necator americanus]|uniref:Globin n=1 Tax=Necator americanus TaxID=51031 RepID=W2TM49_NECAM|nr:globin [Necator americanus]ETN82813.1 globin [Necator americanus]